MRLCHPSLTESNSRVCNPTTSQPRPSTARDLCNKISLDFFEVVRIRGPTFEPQGMKKRVKAVSVPLEKLLSGVGNIILVGPCFFLLGVLDGLEEPFLFALQRAFGDMRVRVCLYLMRGWDLCAHDVLIIDVDITWPESPSVSFSGSSPKRALT